MNFHPLLIVVVASSLCQAEVIDIAPVWSGHPARFALLTHGDVQFVAFYDADREMTLAQRRLNETRWHFKKLGSSVGWDSHNSITMALDREQHLHISGNMHNVPLIYFRSEKPLDIASVNRVGSMTGSRESKATYPVFLQGENDALVFNYRDGSSGNGSTLYNIYDEKSRTWKRLIDAPLFDGEGRMNSYPQTPVKGSDGWYHMSWLWRDTPMAETNHDLSYARSRDLVAWQTADGKAIALPITLSSPGTIIDPIPVRGGIINGSGKIGFDANGEVIISYHKYDAAGKTQLHLARFEEGAWKSHQATAWDHRWEISGGGSLVAEITHSAVELKDGLLTIQIKHPSGSGTFEIDPATLKITRKLQLPAKPLPKELTRVISKFPGMKINWASDPGKASDGQTHQLRWETLPANRDKPRPQPWPEPSMLKLVSFPE